MQQLQHSVLGDNRMKQQLCKGHVTRQTLGHLSLIHCCHLTFYAAIAKYKYVAYPLPILFNILIGWNFNLIIIIVEERFEPMLLNPFSSDRNISYRNAIQNSNTVELTNSSAQQRRLFNSNTVLVSVQVLVVFETFFFSPASGSLKISKKL